MEKLQVMIIEDDFRIANIHKEMIESNASCQVVNSSRTAKEALAYLEQVHTVPHIILLDVYIPDVTGLELLKTLKQTYPQIAIIIASAANDIETFRSARLIGVFDYMTKPIDQARLQYAFQRLLEFLTYSASELTQKEIDRMLWHTTDEQKKDSTKEDASYLPKGIDLLTLGEVQSFLAAYDQKEVTAQTLGELLGISRATARRYLEYLVGIEWMDASLHYGQVGRPQRIYTLRKQYEHN